MVHFVTYVPPPPYEGEELPPLPPAAAPARPSSLILRDEDEDN